MKRLLQAALAALIVLSATTLTAAEKPPTFAMKVLSQYWDDKDKTITTNHGTAFVIDARHAVTNAHIVYVDKLKATAKDVLVETDTKWVKCRVVRFDRKADLALLEAMDDLPAPVELGDDPDGEISAIGWSPAVDKWINDTPLILMDGKVTDRPAVGEVNARFQARLDGFGHGCSGGPVIKAGKLVGVMVAGIAANSDGHTMVKGVMEFIPVSTLKDFLGK